MVSIADMPPTIKRPHFSLLATEHIRAMWELGFLGLTTPLLRLIPHGDGHPVLVCPGFLGSDTSTVFLRQFLREKGYNVHGWDLGQNLGLKTIGLQGEYLAEQVISLYRKTHRKVTLIGWSLGGIMARETAKQLPDQIRQVITLGSPFAGGTQTSNIKWLYEKVTGHKQGDGTVSELEANLKNPPEFVPSTAIYTKGDGIVSWEACREPKSALTDNIEVHASHLGLGVNPVVFAILGDRLALEDGRWKPFDVKKSILPRYLLPRQK